MSSEKVQRFGKGTTVTYIQCSANEEDIVFFTRRRYSLRWRILRVQWFITRTYQVHVSHMYPFQVFTREHDVLLFGGVWRFDVYRPFLFSSCKGCYSLDSTRMIICLTQRVGCCTEMIRVRVVTMKTFL